MSRDAGAGQNSRKEAGIPRYGEAAEIAELMAFLVYPGGPRPFDGFSITP
jgi:hypothetical protein